MTIDEAIYCMKSYLPDDRVEHCVNCPYYGSVEVEKNIYVCRSSDAHKTAIKALEKLSSISDLFDGLESLRIDINVDGFGRSQSEIKRYESMNNMLDDCIEIIKGWLESGNN